MFEGCAVGYNEGLSLPSLDPAAPALSSPHASALASDPASRSRLWPTADQSYARARSGGSAEAPAAATRSFGPLKRSVGRRAELRL